MTQYALITTVPMSLTYSKLVTIAWSGKQGYTQVTETVPANTVINIIDYNGTDPYTPHANTQLVTVPDGTQIGDAYSG